MKEKLKINQDVMNALLPDAPADFVADTQAFIQSLPYREKEKTVKRKIPISLILAAVLALLAVTALAATLFGSRDFIDNVVAPKAKDTDSNMFTREECLDIIAQAEAHGLTLPDELLHRMQKSEEGYYKDEILRAIAKIDLGKYPSTWPIEDQYWLGQLMQEAGVYKYNDMRLPEGDEISQERALGIALSYAKSEYGLDPVELENKELYTRHLQYLETFESEFRKGRRWMIEYSPNDIYHDTYHVAIWSDGTIDYANHFEGIKLEEGKVPTVLEVRQIYHDKYGETDSAGFTEQAYMEMQADLKRAIATYGNDEDAIAVRNLMLQTYAPADESHVTRAQSIDIALEALGKKDDYVYSAVSLYLPGKTANYWKVTVRTDDGWWFVELNAETGEVTFKDKQDEYIIYRNAVLEENLPERINMVVGGNSLKFMTLDDFWGSDVMPKEMWDQLDAVGYTSETGSDLFDDWCHTYGDDSDFWPDAPYAIDYMWHQIDFSADVLPGLPQAGQLTAEEALQKANEYLGEMGSTLPQNSHPAAHIWYGYLENQQGVWVVSYYTSDNTSAEKTEAARVYVEAASGICAYDERGMSQFKGKRRAVDVVEGLDEYQEGTPDPAKGDMGYEEAYALADKTMRSVCAGLVTEALMNDYQVSHKFYVVWPLEIGGETQLHRVWYFCFYRAEYSEANPDVVVYFDAQSGEILTAYYGAPEFGNG